MLTPSSEIIQLLSVFAAGMTAPTFAKTLVLIYGAILAPGRRTVASALGVMGRAQEPNPGKYHRGFNEARWSPMHLSKVFVSVKGGFYSRVQRGALVADASEPSAVGVAGGNVRARGGCSGAAGGRDRGAS